MPLGIRGVRIHKRNLINHQNNIIAVQTYNEFLFVSYILKVDVGSTLPDFTGWSIINCTVNFNELFQLQKCYLSSFLVTHDTRFEFIVQLAVW